MSSEPSRAVGERAPTKNFLLLWTFAIMATVAAFVVHLALRSRIISLGYELGNARAKKERLLEIRHVYEVEAASYRTPERVEFVARTLLGMEPPSADRIIQVAAPAPGRPGDERNGAEGSEGKSVAAPHEEGSP